MSNILILADLTSPLMKPRILMLKDLPYKKYILHNANNITLSNEYKIGLEDFIILEHRKIKSIRLRYLYSFFYTFYLFLKLNPKLIVVHWASRLYQNILLALWGNRVIVHTMGGEINPQEDCYGKKKFFTGLLLRRAKIITGKTDVMHKILLQNFPFVSLEQLKILSFGVEKRFFIKHSVEDQQRMQQEFFGKSFETLFFSIRTFKPIHFHKEILESFLKLYANDSRVGLLVSTQSLDKEYLTQCEQDLHLQSQHNIFLRTIPHEQMHNILKAVDCVISYKLCDGISQSLMESVAANRFIIANRLENHAMLLQHRHNAYLIENLTELPQAMQYAQTSQAQPYAVAFLDREQQKALYLQILHHYYGVIIMIDTRNNVRGGGAILILADLTSPLMKPRILMLKDLPYKKYILHNANNVVLNQETLDDYQDFIVLQHPKIQSIKLRYLYSFFYTLYLLICLNPKLIVVHWASRLYQNILLALWGNRVIVHTMGGDIDSSQDCQGKKRFFIALLLRKCKVITTKSNYMSQMLQSLQIPLESYKIKQLSWGVEKRFFNANSTSKEALQLQLFGRTFECLFFSIRAFTPFYHSKEILEAFLKDFVNSSDIALLVSTMRKDKQYFESYAPNLPNLFYREISPSEIHHYLFASDVVVSYSRSDGLSQSLLEAVAARRLIVANNLPQHNELLQDKRNAVLFEKPEELPTALQVAKELAQKPIVLDKKADFILNIREQQDYYHQILKENFNV